MTKYRKKPVVVEARRLRLGEYFGDWDGVEVNIPGGGALVHAIGGTVKAEYGDWIIKGIKGEFYPCKPDIFDATYEAVVDYRDARGAVPWEPGMMLPEDAIRKGRE